MARTSKKKQPTAATALDPAGRRRDELLDAAFATVAEKGLEGLRTRDIAARAGVNISTLHYYFGTKEAVITALVGRVGELFRSGNVAHHGKRNRMPTLRSHLESAWRSFQSEPHLFVVLQELSLRAHRDARVRAAFRTLHAEWAGMIETLVREGIERGELRAGVEPRAAARIITSFVMGASLQLGIHPQAFAAEGVTAELERWLAK